MAYNRKIKVGQDTISSLKSMGMKEAVRYANSLVGTKGNAEIIEGARRLYGSRVKAASTAPKATSPDAARNVAIKTKPQMTDAGKNPRKLTQPKPTVKPTDKVFGVSVADWRKGYGAPVNPPKPKVKTAAQKAAETKATAARRKAAAAAVKAANGRTH